MSPLTDEERQALIDAAQEVVAMFEPDPDYQKWAVRRNALLASAVEKLRSEIAG